MRTLREIYCERHKCSPEQFARRVFWRALYPHAWLAAPWLLWWHYDYFSADRSLISHAADATTMKSIREEVRDYFWDSQNRGWLRRTARVRVSGERLKNLCRHYLPEGPGSHPPVPTAAEPHAS